MTSAVKDIRQALQSIGSEGVTNARSPRPSQRAWGEGRPQAEEVFWLGALHFHIFSLCLQQTGACRSRLACAIGR